MSVRSAYIAIAALLVFGTGVTSFAATKPLEQKRVLTAAEKSIVGTYRCRSYNVSGGGGTCRLAPPIVLKRDGTYTMSLEKGVFSLKKGKLFLSSSKLRGLGAVTHNPATLSFSYSYRGWKHHVSYMRAESPESKKTLAILQTVPVELTLNFPETDGSVAWVNVITLVPQGQTPASASYHPESLAIQEGRTSTIHASFYGAKEVRTGVLYDVYASSGFESRKVGTLDAMRPTGLVTRVISVEPFTSAPARQADSPASAPETSSETPAPGSCNPNLPHYAGGC
ncbi:hypothetical protein HY627_01005 [Candidatus Uhrbacteria bacterium]|nr:hypothetical protein [Candidatus Uhrbacteria bacterium]